MIYPSVSFVIPTYNSQKTLAVLLISIAEQNYPKIEIVVSDGGSEDKTLSIAKKFGAKIVRVSSRLQNVEYNRAAGAYRATGELLCFTDHDNILPHKDWLKRMVEPLLLDKTIVGVETLRYHYDRNYSSLSRYFSLMGTGDILPFYLGKDDRLSFLYDSPKQYGFFKKAKVMEEKEYFKVIFRRGFVPTLGSNGFLIWKDLLFQQADVRPEYFFHIDVNVDLINKRHSTYAFIKDSLIHQNQARGLIDYFGRRVKFMDQYYLTNLSKRRYSVVEKKDLFTLLFFIFYGLTIVKPLWDSIKGFRKVNDVAWFLNPVMCFLTVILYGSVLIKGKLFLWLKS